MINPTVKDSFTVAKGWRKRGYGRIKPMTTQTKVRSTEEALKLARRAINNLISSSHLKDPQPWRDARQDSVDALTAIKEALAQPDLQTCNCRWDGEVQVQQCTLHESHIDAVHEWAERAKTAEAKLKAQPKEPEQEPVAWKYQTNYAPFLPADTGVRLTDSLRVARNNAIPESIIPLYTTPPTQQGCSQRTAAAGEDTRRAWVGLSHDEDDECACKADAAHERDDTFAWASVYRRAIEAKLKEKNNVSR